jgi:hypothetical protein
MKDHELTKGEDLQKEAKDRRDFLKKVGIGGAAAIATGGVLGAKSVNAKDKPGLGAGNRKSPGRFNSKYFSQHRKPLAEAASKFTIDLRDFKLDDEGLAAVRNAMVAAAISQVKTSGMPTPQNSLGSFSTFSTFSTFSSFSSFSSFGSGANTPIDNSGPNKALNS